MSRRLDSAGTYAVRLIQETETGIAWVVGPADRPGAVRIFAPQVVCNVDSHGNLKIAYRVPADVSLMTSEQAHGWLVKRAAWRKQQGPHYAHLQYVIVRVEPETRTCFPSHSGRTAGVASKSWRRATMKARVVDGH